jgi:cobalt/nickel transport system ATP-binding protein
MRPEILALDEPTSMLDPRGRREVTALLQTLGGTQLIVTHDLDMIAGLCDRALVLSGGRLVADGAAGDILADKALLETHGLI